MAMARPSEGEELMLVIRIAVSEWGAAPAGPNRGRRAGQGYPPPGVFVMDGAMVPLSKPTPTSLSLYNI